MGCRPELATRSATIIQLVITKLIIFIVLTQLVLMSPSSATFSGHIEREKQLAAAASNGRRIANSGLSVVRHYKLHSRCSGKHVLLQGRRVAAVANNNNVYADLRVETLSFDSLVRIQSALSRDYLCFNKRGMLTVRPRGDDQLCVFREVHAPNDFTELVSVVNASWFVGFDKRGRRLAGDQWTEEAGSSSSRSSSSRSKRCYQFVKTDSTTTTSSSSDTEQQQQHRIRHPSHHQRQRHHHQQQQQQQQEVDVLAPINSDNTRTAVESVLPADSSDSRSTHSQSNVEHRETAIANIDYSAWYTRLIEQQKRRQRQRQRQQQQQQRRRRQEEKVSRTNDDASS